jgi:hypothetical protein
MQPDDPMQGSGAHWCDPHQRWECTRNAKTTRKRCHNPAFRGLDRCRMHAGERAEVAKARGEARMTAWSAMSGEQVVSDAAAVMGMLQMSWLRVHMLAALLEEQFRKAQEARDHDGDARGEAVGFDAAIEEGQARSSPPVGPGAGLIGHTFSGVKDLGIFASGEAVRGLAQLEAQERDRCVKYAKAASDMKIGEEQVRLAEQQGAALAGVIGRILDALQLTPDQQERVPEIVPRELRAVAGGGTT